MNKTDFLTALERQLKKLKKSDRKRFLEYYREIIDDSVEDGCTEEEAIRRIGTPEEVAREILIEQTDHSEESVSASKKAVTITLLVIGSPLWATVLLLVLVLALALAFTAAALAVTGIMLIGTVYLMLWCLPLMIGSCSIGALILSVVSLIGAVPVGTITPALGIVQFGVGIGMIGIFILTALTTVKLSKLFAKATAGFTRWLKKLFCRRKGVLA